MFLFTCYESQHFVAERSAECQPFSSETQGAFPKEDLLNSLHMAKNMMNYQKAELFSLHCRCLSYLSCPAWWIKCISHDQCTFKTNMKRVLDKWQGEDLTENGWKILGGGSLWQLEAGVWSVRGCEVIRGWSRRGSRQKQCKEWGPWSHSLWSSWNCPSRPTGKRWCMWQRSSPNLRDTVQMGMCDSAEQYPRWHLLWQIQAVTQIIWSVSSEEEKVEAIFPSSAVNPGFGSKASVWDS